MANSDRENCTVFVTNLPSRTAEEDLKALFKDVRDFVCLG
jgi:RNA recognition motif-containing protein